MTEFEILCLGSRDMLPLPDNDCSHYLMNGHILIDCGTSPVKNMLQAGADLDAVDCIIFTHLHPDHCIGLPSLLYYLREVSSRKLSDIKIYGPKNLTESLVRHAADFYGQNEMPRVIELDGGETLVLDDGTTLKTVASVHAVPGLCYRFERQGKSVGFSGDTYTTPEITEFFTGCDALVYECSFGRPAPDEDLVATAKWKIQCGHSSPVDAANVAEHAKSERVYLVHSRNEPKAQEAYFSEHSKIPVKFIRFGDRFTV